MALLREDRTSWLEPQTNQTRLTPHCVALVGLTVRFPCEYLIHMGAWSFYVSTAEMQPWQPILIVLAWQNLHQALFVQISRRFAVKQRCLLSAAYCLSSTLE